MRIRLLHR
jgi:hypothetical protein